MEHLVHQSEIKDMIIETPLECVPQQQDRENKDNADKLFRIQSFRFQENDRIVVAAMGDDNAAVGSDYADNQAEPNSLDTRANYDLNARTCKVPQITLAFWIIKCCATTVGETLSDYFASTLNLGLGYTSAIFYPFLFVVLILQFFVKRYIPFLYWLTVVIMSICGTIFTDGLHDDLGLDLRIEIVVFFILMSGCFSTWYLSERTLDIHSITTLKREGFYWATILFTFALGTAVGDQIAESCQIGYGFTLLIFVSIIILVFAMWYLLKLDDILCFWIAYIMTRPLGAATGDLLSASKDEGAAGLGTTTTSLIFLGIIISIVGFLTYTKYDQIKTIQQPLKIVEIKNYESIPQQRNDL